MTDRPTAPPRRNRVRTRLAVGLTVSTLLVAAVVAVAATGLSAWQSNDDAPGTQAGAARVGDDVAVVIVTDDNANAAAAQARTDTLRWALIALALSVIPAIGVGWFAAGRMLGTVDQALADIEAADEERLRRLQEVVHELRTPLAVMGTNLELAATEPEVDAETATLIDAARRAVGRMERTVDDLAGHGRLEVGAAGPVDVAALAGEVVAEHAGPAHSRGVHLVVAGTAPTTVPTADQAAVQTALGNFVGNAVRLAPRGSAITVDWGETAGWAWVAVSDEGPGLAPELHARVFERGWRGRHERDRTGDGGAGLGLTIARQLTEAQGGVLTVASDEGGGSTFTVWLPLNARVAPTDIVAADGVHPATEPWRKDLLPS
jgi:signal transduction histidine kinase